MTISNLLGWSKIVNAADHRSHSLDAPGEVADHRLMVTVERLVMGGGVTSMP
jgi:hypothetical protein